MIRENLDHILPFISLSFATHSSTQLTIACTARICDAIRSSAEFGSSVSHFSLMAPDVECFGSCSFFAAAFLGHGFGIIPAPGSFASSAFPVPPSESFGSLPECSRSLWEQYPLRPWVSQGNGAKKEKQNVSESRATHRLPR